MDSTDMIVAGALGWLLLLWAVLALRGDPRIGRRKTTAEQEAREAEVRVSGGPKM